jgi:hypothetical protein
MENLKKLSRAEMKKIEGGLSTWYICNFYMTPPGESPYEDPVGYSDGDQVSAQSRANADCALRTYCQYVEECYPFS